MTPRDLYELHLAHQKAQREDAIHRAEIRAEVERCWPVTLAWIDHRYEQGAA
jgi:hypothetical protein